jgi:hypothetical protein
MSGQYFGERVTTPEIVKKTEDVTDNEIENSDLFADQDPVDASLVNETPMGGTVAAVGPLEDSITKDFRGVEPTDQVYPEAETAAGLTPLDEAMASEIPIIGDVAYKSPVNAAVEDRTEKLEPVPYKSSEVTQPVIHDSPVGASPGLTAALLTPQESEHFRMNWNEIQGKFVDDPRSAVQQADTLVSEVIGQITQMFAKEHSLLESQWNQGNDVSTEDLRKALQRYRSFFNRLVV